MAAPALVALAHGSRDPRSAATIKALVAEVKAMRPDLKIETAFLDLSKPGFDTVVDRLVKAGHEEIVVVPLLLTEAYHAKVDVPETIAAATARHENLRIRATHVLGLEPVFLEVLDRRLRTALSDARIRELDALVELAAQVAGVPFAAINLLSAHSQHQVATAGFEGQDSPIESSMCRIVVESGRPIMLEDATQDGDLYEQDGRFFNLTQDGQVVTLISSNDRAALESVAR